MATLREIRRRIKSIKNTAQITKAMELVAASRMRRAQERVLSSRPYAQKMHDVLGDLTAYTVKTGAALHPLLAHHETGKVCVVLVTSDRGLCGAFNTNMIRHALDTITEHRAKGDDVVLVTVGKRGRDLMVRLGMNLLAEFTGLGDKVTILDVAPIVRVLSTGYTDGTFKEVHLGFSRYISTVSQQPTMLSLLPVQANHLIAGDENLGTYDYIFEPNAEAILDALLPRYIEVQMYQALLESVASEQSARMVAMRNATDNALDIIEHLTLTYNKARQAGITKELIDITTSAAAIER